MAMIRSKQIKLSAAGDILIGGVNGAGSVLSKGAAGTFLKPTAGGLEWARIAASEVDYGAGSIADELVSLDGRLDTAESDIGTIKADATALVGRVTTAEGDIDALEGRATALESDVATAKTDISGLQTRMTTAEADIDAVEGRATALEGRATALEGRADNVESDLSDLTTEVGAIEDAIGLETDGSFNGFDGTNYLDTATTIKGGMIDLDTAIKGVADDIASLAGLNALRFKGTVSGAASSADLTALNAVTGDLYRIITAGSADFAGLGFDVNMGDFVAKTTEGWVKFDNTDPSVSSTDSNVTVSGNTFAGFTVALNKFDVTSNNAAITVSGGANAALAAVSIDFDASEVSINDLSGVLDVVNGGTGLSAAGAEHAVLTAKADGSLEYAFVSTIRDASGVAVAAVVGSELVAASATTSGSDSKAYTTKGYVDTLVSDAIDAATVAQTEEDFAVTVGAANYSFDLAKAPAAGVSVYFNGIKLRANGFTVAGTTVTLVDANVGYSAEAGDVLSASYMA